MDVDSSVVTFSIKPRGEKGKDQDVFEGHIYHKPSIMTLKIFIIKFK